MNYTSYQYITPPRAEARVMEGALFFYEKRGWQCQVKKNGTRSVVYLPPKGEGLPLAKTRHADDPDHKAWRFTDASIKCWMRLQNDRWNAFDCELLHSKGNEIRDTNYVFDALVLDGTMLIGKTMEERYSMLMATLSPLVSGRLKGPESHYVIDSNTWLAKNHERGFASLFQRLCKEDEGLVLKNPKAPLTTRENESWMVKCRKPNKNLGF